MDEKDEAMRARRVTCALAELDLLFSLARKEGGEERLWDLGPMLPSDEQAKSGASPVSIRLAFNGGWLVALSSTTLKHRPDQQLLLQLLKLPLEMPLARVALGASEGDEFTVVITSDISEARIDANSLKESIGAVVGCAQKAEALLKSEMAPKLALSPPRP